MAGNKSSKGNELKLTRELKRREAELAIINSVQQGLASKLETQEIYDLVGDKILEFFEAADAITLYTFDLENNLMIPCYMFEKGARFTIPPLSVPPLWKEFIRRGQPLMVTTGLAEFVASIDPDAKPMAGVMPRSALAVPMRVNGIIRGVINVQNVDQENAFSQSDLDLLCILASSMGVALENVQLFNETQRLLKETENRNAELAVINSVQQGLASKLEMQEIYDLVGDKLREIFHDTDLSIILHNPETNLLHMPYGFEFGKRWTHEPIPLQEQGFNAHVLRTGRTLVINENIAQEMEKYGLQVVSGPPKESGARGPYTFKYGDIVVPDVYVEKSTVRVPLRIGGQVRGVITLANMECEHAFNDSHVHLLETLASSMSVALENARLFDDTNQRNAELAVINSVQEGLASKLDMQAIYDLVGDKIREIFDAQTVTISTYDPELKNVIPRFCFEKGQYYQAEPYKFYEINRRLIREHQALVIHTREEFEEYGVDTKLPIIAGTEISRSAVYVPLMAGGQVHGHISLQNVDRENAFGESDVRLLETLANSMSVALENARLWEQEKLFRKALQRELDIGREIQAGFLPTELPQVEGWEIAALLMSAREVAGDFYDVFELPDGNIGLVIADVCDKGVGAALYMTLFRSLVRAAANLDHYEHVQPEAQPHSTKERLQLAMSLTNDYIAETHGESGMFATLFFGILDPRTGRLAYVNGGHEPPLILHGGCVRARLGKTGPAVGVLAKYQFNIAEIDLTAGDMFFAFTDGLPDCKNPKGDFHGHERLLPLFQEQSSASELIHATETGLREYIAGGTQFDDITLLSVRRK